MLDILGKRYLFFAISALIIIPGLIILAIYGMPFSIDFNGGSLVELSFPSGNLPSTETVNSIYKNLGMTDVQVQTTGTGSLIVRSEYLNEDQHNQVITEMEKTAGEKPEVLRFDSVGPTIGKEVTSRAGLAIGVSSLAVVLFILLAFRGVQHALRYGVCAILAMLHDLLVMISITAIGGKFFGWEFDTLFLTAFLTVIGFSVQDKIVVFDRIRENSTIFRKLDFEKLANHSIVQTLQRSINTQLMTSEFLLLALALFGGITLREMSIILLIGLLMGTYSSIFIAAPVLVIWEKKEWQTWFKRNTSQA